MTCSKRFGRLLQVGCLGLIGMLTAVGCGGSESKKDGGAGGIGGEAGPGDKAALNLDKSTVNLGTLEVKGTGVATVTVTNTGKQTSGAIAVTASAGVTATGCTSPLSAGQACTITITATPTAAGPFSGTVTIAANPGASPTPLTVSVIATVSPAGIFSVAPGVIDLGNVRVGEPAPRQTITVTAAVAISDLTITSSGPDVQIDRVASTCTPVLAANASCTVAVNFTATSAGAKSNAVVISGGGANGRTVSVPVTAVAQRPAQLAINPSTAQSFVASAGQASTAITFGVANLGDLPTGTLAATLTGADAASFVVTGTTCLVLAPLAGCTVSVAYQPAAATTAAQTANLVVTDSAVGGSSVTVVLSGTATPPSDLVITPVAGDVGSVLVGQTGAPVAFTVTNQGATASGALTVTVSSGEFVILNNTCTGQSLAPTTGACTLAIALKPTSVGGKNATLTVAGTSGNPAVKTITGTGTIPARLVAAPAALDFGSVRVNKTGTAQLVTVTNVGGANTDVLSFTKGGQFAAFPITANTCTAALGPGATCTFTVNFAPTDVGSFAATHTITDGVVSSTVAVSGSALAATNIDITPTMVTQTTTPESYPATVVGGSTNEVTFTVTAASTFPAGLADTGAIAVTMAGTNPADFVIATDGCTGKTLLANGTCTIAVRFSPTAVGERQASLGVTSANGGSVTATLQSEGLAVIEIVPQTTGEAGLDFAQVPLLGDEDEYRVYQVVVRGPNSEAAHTSAVQVTLLDPSQPADFAYLSGLSGSGSLYNPCNSATNQAVTLDFENPASRPANWDFDGAAFTCEFAVYFYPQSSKGVKTATLTATGSANSSDSKTLTGEATGSLTFDYPDGTDFGSDWMVGDSSNTQTTMTMDAQNKTVTLVNHSTTANVGPVSLTLSGPNAAEFKIVGDDCSTRTLAPRDSDPNTCNVTVAFLPTSVGPKTVTLTANGGDETASVDFTAGAGAAFNLTIAPDQCQSVDWTSGYPICNTETAHAFAPVAQTAGGEWVQFTITNPAGAARSAQVDYGIGDDIAGGYAGWLSFVTANGNDHAYGTCGISGTTSLAPGQSCTVWVQFKPNEAFAPGEEARAVLYTWDATKGEDFEAFAVVFLTGKVLSSLSIAPATYAFPDTPEGVPSSPVTLKVTNLGTTAAQLVIPDNTPANPFNVDEQSECKLNTSLAAGQDCDLVVRFIGQVGAAGTPNATAEGTLTIGNLSTTDGGAAVEFTGTSVKPAKLEAVGWNNTPTNWPNEIDLGATRIGERSGAATITFRNTGSLPTSALHFAWEGRADDVADNEFIIQSEAADGCVGKTSLAAGATCTVTVSFEASSSALAGPRAAKGFTLAATAGGQVRLFKFKAAVVDPAASAWTAATNGAQAFYSFATTAAGSTTSTQQFQVTNGTGAAIPLVLTVSGADAANFGISAGTVSPCGASLAAANSCTFTVTFTPTAWTSTTAYRLATVQVTADSTLGLMGRVQQHANLVITPSAADSFAFGQVVIGSTTPPAKTFTVTNTGEGTSAAITMVRSATPSANVSVGGGCNVALAAGQSCTGTITVNPTSPPAAYADSIQATAPGADSSTVMAVTANSVIDTLLSLSANTMTFPAQAVGTASDSVSVTITNQAGARTAGLFTITVADTANFTIAGTTCARASDIDVDPEDALAGGDTCEVQVRFRPQALGTGTFTTTLTFQASPGNTQTVNITGTAVSALTIDKTSPLEAVNPITAPLVVTVTVAEDAPATDYIQTSLSTTDYMIVQDECVWTKLSGTGAGTRSCEIRVAFIGTAPEPNKTATLTVNGGSPGQTASLVLNSTATP